MAFDDSGCARCGGQVAAERISAHPSGITIEFGVCVVCRSQLRRVLASGLHALAEPAGPWSVVPTPGMAPRRRRMRSTRPPRRVGTRRPGR